MGDHLSVQSSASRRQMYKNNRKIGMSKLNAAIAAGFPRSLVEKHRDHLPVPQTPANKTDFFALFEQKQMTDIKKVEHCLSGMNAMKVVSLETDQTNNKGKTIWVEHEVPDWQARYKYFEMMLRLCKQMEKEGSTNTAIFLGNDFAQKLKEARERATDEMKEKVKRTHPLTDVSSQQSRPRPQVIDVAASPLPQGTV